MTQNPTTISHHKIIAFILFICAALIALLFVFYMTHPAAKTNLSDAEGTLFPAGRSIKSFELLTANNKIFNEKQLQNHWTLAFFGFTHCDNVCPATFEMLKRAYPALKQNIPNLQVVLISLNPETDTPTKITQYVQGFHPDFIGLTGKIQNIRKLQSQLGIYAAPINRVNKQIEHSASILLINPEGKWVGIYPYGLPPQKFVGIIQKSLKFLS